MPDGALAGPDVNRAVKAVIRPLLADQGFTRFTARKAWRSGPWTVDLVDVRSFSRQIADGVGCTTISFAISVGSYFACTGSPLDRPQTYERTLGAELGKGIRQPWFRPYGGDRMTDRVDVWYVLPDGSNLGECVDDARAQISEQGLPLLDRWRDPACAFQDLLSERSTEVGLGRPGIRMPGAPDSPLWRDTTLAIGHLTVDDPRSHMRAAPVLSP